MPMSEQVIVRNSHKFYTEYHKEQQTTDPFDTAVLNKVHRSNSGKERKKDAEFRNKTQ